MSIPSLHNRVAAHFKLALLFACCSAAAQQPPKEDFTLFSEKSIALTHAEVVDGTGAAARNDQTIVIRDGRIVAIGAFASTPVPKDTKVRDLTGHSVTPGFVMMHEHMFYPTGLGNYSEMPRSFPRLYLAGGATTIRTAGSMAPYTDINLRNQIAKGEVPGPDIDVSAPFIEGPALLFLDVRVTKDAKDARSLVSYWANEGATSYKVYMNLSRDTLAAVIDEAHKRGQKVTGHLCSITYREAADLGIDNLEHGFFASSDFFKEKVPDVCPGQKEVDQSLETLDPDGPEAKALIDHLIARHVALTSTLTIFETFTPGRPMTSAGALELLVPELREQYLARWSKIQQEAKPLWPKLLKTGMRIEKRFVESGGHLMAGTDPTGYGGVVPGYSNVHEIELLMDAGFAAPEAIRIATLNGAQFLGRDKDVGTLEAGKRADLVVFKGSLSADKSALRNLQWTMKAGVAYDSAKIFAAMKGKVGLY